VKISTNAKFFLAFLAVAFALQVMFDIQSDWNNPEKGFSEQAGHVRSPRSRWHFLLEPIPAKETGVTVSGFLS
jgi:hypothetical protein